MNIKFEIIELVPEPLLVIRKVTSVKDLPQEIGQAYHQIATYLNQLGEQPAGVPFVAYYNLDMENLDVEMGFPVAKELPGQGIITNARMPAVRAATFTHIGPYQDMSAGYEAINLWLSEQKEEPTGVVYEYYYNSPAEVPEAELMTKVLFLLK